MKRKTNLFYTTGYDSKFITFSNYTEAMTGNFLSTNTKLFPSRFLALNIENLNKESKRHIIKYLALYYESKLAACRDELENNNKLSEDEILPLNYLLEALYSISEITDDFITLTNGMKISDDEPNGEYIDEGSDLLDDSDNDDNISPIEPKRGPSIKGDSNVNDTTDVNDTIDVNDASNENDIVIIGGDQDIYDGTNNDIETSSDYDEEEPEEEPEEEVEDIDILLVPNFYSNIISLNYIGDVTEQNYNGTFTDTICIIDLNDYRVPSIITQTGVYDDNNVQIDIPKSNKDTNIVNNECIYGWHNEILETYKDYISIYDLKNSKYCQYRLNSYIQKLQISGNTTNKLEFNCIIPLYDLVNTDYTSNFSSIKELEEINLSSDVEKDENSIYKMYNLNVPLGMWFYTIDDNTDPNENKIKLYRDNETGFSQSWSLTISSQFKPFPYSQSMPNEICTNQDSSAFMTFAQVLANQNRLIDKFNEYTYQFKYMDERLANIQSQLNNIGTLYNIDNIHKEMANYQNYMNENYNTFKDQIYSYINNLRWKVTE